MIPTLGALAAVAVLAVIAARHAPPDAPRRYGWIYFAVVVAFAWALATITHIMLGG